MLRKPVLCLLFTLLSACVFAGNTDSLKSVLSRTRDNHKRAIIMLKIANVFYRQQDASLAKFDSGILYASLAYEISKATGNDALIMQALYSISYGWDSKGKNEEALKYVDESMPYALKRHDADMQILLLKKKGTLLRKEDRYAEAIECYRKGLELVGSLNRKSDEGFLYRAMGKAYAGMGDIETAFELTQHSIHICDSIKEYYDIVNDYTFIGSMLMRRNKLNDALNYFLIADSLSKEYKITDKNGFISENYTDIANCYSQMHNYDNAIAAYNNTISILKKNGKVNKRVMASYNGLGNVYAQKGDFSLALRYLQMAKNVNDSFFEDEGFARNNYSTTARMYLKAGQTDKALQQALLVERLADKDTPDLKERLSIVGLMSDVYVAKGDYSQAHKYDAEYKKLQNKLYEKAQRDRGTAAEVKFRLSEKDRELALLEKENELQKMKHRQLFLVLVLSLIVVAVGAGGYRQSLRKNEQLKKQKRVIDDQLAQLAAASAQKAKFYANISHELRTPVTLLTGMLEIARNEKQPGSQKLDVAYNNSLKLKSMIEEILNLSKMETTGMALKKETVAIAFLLKRIVYVFEPFIHKEGLKLEYDDEGIKEVFAEVNEDKFEKIINNLIFNAIKFNNEHGTISVKAYSSPCGNHINIDVRDTGKGMSEKDLPYIFGRFYQASLSGKQAEGLGIGLSLVKEFTELIGGSVKVTSKLGEGSVFSLQFPIAAKPAQVPATEAVVELIKETWEHFKDKQTVLVVEDNAEMRYYLREVLGHKVNIAEAGNGKEAFAWLQKHAPDLIISDIMMPEMDGHEFIAQLKSADNYKKIPVITLTALADSENQLKILRIGVDDYIVKPFNADELCIRVYNLLRNHAERRAFTSLPEEPGDVNINSREAEEFRGKITEYVLGRLRSEDLSVNGLALELGLSERQFYRLAKSLTGCTPAQLIKEVRLQKAYELLLSGKIYKVEDVARRVGFEKASYFSLQFYERFGKRPTEFL